MNRWALLTRDNIVHNVVIWGGGESMWADLTPIELATDERCAPGWLYDSSATPRFIEQTGE